MAKLCQLYFLFTTLICICFFKTTMVDKFDAILHKENELNLVTRLWCKISTFTILNHKLLEFMKLAKIYIVQVFGFGEDEWTFIVSTLWSTNNEINWTFIWIFTLGSIVSVFYFRKFSLWPNHCQMVRWIAIFYKCIRDSNFLEGYNLQVQGDKLDKVLWLCHYFDLQLFFFYQLDSSLPNIIFFFWPFVD